MSEEIFFNNIKRRIIDITVQIKHASQIGISNQAKSGYYRFAILLACTIVEGLLFRLVKKYLGENGGSMGVAITYKDPHNIPDKYTKEKTVLCIQKKIDISLSNQTKFSELIEYASKNKLISKKEKTKLEKMMRLRNKIHLQSLKEKDAGYTKQKLDDIFSIVDSLLKK
jgi:hypothetical protein